MTQLGVTSVHKGGFMDRRNPRRVAGVSLLTSEQIVYCTVLPEKNHLLGVGETSGSELVEIDSTRLSPGIPLNLMLSG